jgi:hypothetical protein
MGHLGPGFFAVAAVLVSASVIAILVKNAQGTGTLIGSAGTAFTNSIVAATGSATSLQSYPSGF